MELNKDVASKLYELIPGSGGKGLVVKKRRVLIGSSDACDVVIDDPRVNAIHAVLEVNKADFKLYDMNSEHGSFVNGQKIIAERFNISDELSFADVKFKFKDYDPSEVLPPTLEMLDPGIPPRMDEVNLPSSPFKDESEEATIPRVVYPLEKDPKAEFSEYIFEETDGLYPIFKYDQSSIAVEVIILFDGRILSVDYIPYKKGSFKLAGIKTEESQIEYPYLGKSEVVDFVEIDTNGGGITVNPLYGYESLRLSDDAESHKPIDGSAPIALNHGDILRYRKERVQVFVRGTQAPPRVKAAPFFRREAGLKRYLFLMLFLVFSFLTAMNVYEIDEEVDKEKVPERIATILYKKKVYKAKSEPLPVIDKKKEPAPKKNVIVKKKPEPNKPEKVVAKVVKDTKVVKPMTGDPKKNVTQKVKKAEPNKSNVNKVRNKVTTPKKSGATKRRKAVEATRKARVNSKSRGAVDVYKADNFKSTISSLMAKGGSVKGSSASTNTGSNVGLNSMAKSTGDGATLKTAKVSNSVGSLTGSTTGKLDTSKGTEGLVNKRSIYTAGLPYKTVILGGMDPDIIRKILQEHIPQFRYCYQRELDVASQSFSGIVRLNFIIGSSGHVSKAGVQSSDRSLPANVRRCVVNVLKGIKFPAPRGGGVVEVKQPFNFYPKQ